MADDKNFNLKLIIQKQEEELNLYRNGTTSSELLDLIHEKDAELNVVKPALEKITQDHNSLTESHKILKDNFMKLVKTSQKTLGESDSLKAQLEETKAELVSMTSMHDEAVSTLAATAEALHSTEGMLQTANERHEDDANTIEKLQEQSMGHLKNLNAQKLKYSDLEKQTKELRKQLQCAEIDIWKDKEKITELQMEYRDQSTQYVKDKAAFAETSAAAHKLLASKCKEVDTLTARVGELQRSLEERDAALQLSAREKDDTVREMKRQIDQLQSNHDDFVQASKDTIASREEHWKNESQRLQKLNEHDAARIRKFEADRTSLSHFKRDMDTLVSRNKELEDKIRRQEQYMKTRLLRDRAGGRGGNSSNVMVGSGPEASAKPRPLVGSAHHGNQL